MITPKELKALIKVLRKENITRFECNGLKFELGSVIKPVRKLSKSQAANTEAPDLIETDGLTEEELLFYSAGGIPKDDN